MDTAARHRTLLLLGIVEERARPKRDGDGDGFIDPDGKGPAPDKTPYVPAPRRHWREDAAKKAWRPPAGPSTAGGNRVRPIQLPEPEPKPAATLREHAAHWHADLTDVDHLVEHVNSGSTPARVLHTSDGVKVAATDFDDGAEGAITIWTGTDQRIGDDMADSDQLVSALARAIGIDAPPVLRVDEDKTVSDIVDGDEWAGDPDDRLGLLDLLAGVDDRDPSTVVDTADGPIPVRTGNGFAALDDLPADPPQGKPSTDERRLRRIAAIIDAAGPNGLSRTDITARAGNLDARARDKALGELLATGRYILVPAPNGNTGFGARIVSIEGGLGGAPLPSGGLSPSWLAAATAPDDLLGAVWAAFADGGEWTDNPLTTADVAWLRRQIEPLRAQFEHLGRGRWWQFAMDRLDVLGSHAHGTVNLFAPQ